MKSFHYYMVNHQIILEQAGKKIGVDHVSCEVPTDTHWDNRGSRMVIKGKSLSISIKDFEGIGRAAFIK